MTWHDMNWHDLTWHERVMTLRDMTQHDVTWNDMLWHDATWSYVTGDNMKWHVMTWCYVMWRYVTWHDVTWNDMLWRDVAWCYVTGDNMKWHDVNWHKWHDIELHRMTVTWWHGISMQSTFLWLFRLNLNPSIIPVFIYIIGYYHFYNTAYNNCTNSDYFLYFIKIIMCCIIMFMFLKVHAQTYWLVKKGFIYDISFSIRLYYASIAIHLL